MLFGKRGNSIVFPKRAGYVLAISKSLNFNSYKKKKKKKKTLPVTFSVSQGFFLAVKQLSVSIMTVKMVFTLGERVKKLLSF